MAAVGESTSHLRMRKRDHGRHTIIWPVLQFRFRRPIGCRSKRTTRHILMSIVLSWRSDERGSHGSSGCAQGVARRREHKERCTAAPTDGWPCTSAPTLRFPIDQNNSWRQVKWSVRHGLGERRHGRLDVSINIPIVFSCNIIYVSNISTSPRQGGVPGHRQHNKPAHY